LPGESELINTINNNQIQEMYRRLEWADLLVRMSDDRTIKKVFQGKPDARAG
jgi:hypothetical protein